MLLNRSLFDHETLFQVVVNSTKDQTMA